MYGKPAILALEDIEITNCMINLSDDPLTTHVYVEGNQTIIGQTDQELGWLMTSGVATMENTALFEQLRKNAPGDMVGMTGMDIMRKFGVRPLKQNYQLSGSAALEFLLACQLFMGKWSAMYETNMSFTFMPDLFPGMRVSLVGHNLQLYCSEVTHTFDYEQGFTTTARLSSVSSPNAAKAIEGSNPLSNWSWPSDFGRGPFDTDHDFTRVFTDTTAGCQHPAGSNHLHRRGVAHGGRTDEEGKLHRHQYRLSRRCRAGHPIRGGSMVCHQHQGGVAAAVADSAAYPRQADSCHSGSGANRGCRTNRTPRLQR